MPYLRVTCPHVDNDRRREVAAALTEAVVEIFTPSRGPSAADIRARTTVHFACYGPEEFVRGRPRPRRSPAGRDGRGERLVDVDPSAVPGSRAAHTPTGAVSAPNRTP